MQDPMSINKAAEVTQKSIPTIRDRLEKGLLPNAVKIKQGTRERWQIPLNDLVAAGLMPIAPAAQGSDRPEPESDSKELLVKIKHLETELATAREHSRDLQRQLEQANERETEDRQSLKNYRDRDAARVSAIETRETQDKRRRLWPFSRAATAPAAPDSPSNP